MHSIIAVSDLRVGMFIRLDLSWIAHPFPVSSFKITRPEQIASIRGLGLEHVQWLPERSDVGPGDGGVRAAAVSERAPLTDPSEPPEPPEPPAAPDPRDETHAEPPDDPRAQRRAQLAAQRQALRQCEAGFDEAALTLTQVNALVIADPEAAAAQAQALARALIAKMLSDGEVCIRLLSSQTGDRLTTHALNVTVIASLLGRAVGLPEDELTDLATGALLHDIGKLYLPPRTHHPDDDFTGAELKAYRDHVALGVARGRDMKLGAAALHVVAQHHEMADGSGFPGGIPLEAQSKVARLVALVNRYDRLCNPGPRGPALTPHEAVSVLYAQCRHKFDMTLLGTFIRMMGVYPAGSVVQLTDDRYAIVMAVNASRPLKPRVLVHDGRVPRDEALLLDLESAPGLGIRRSLRPSQLPLAAASYLAPRTRVTYYFDSMPPERGARASAAEVMQ